MPGVSGLFRQTFLLLVLVDSVHSNAGTLLLQLQLQQLPFLPFPSSVTGQACCAPAPAFRCQPFRSFGGSALCSTALHTANIAAAAAGFKEDEDSPLSSNLLKRSLPHPIPFPFPLFFSRAGLVVEEEEEVEEEVVDSEMTDRELEASEFREEEVLVVRRAAAEAEDCCRRWK